MDRNQLLEEIANQLLRAERDILFFASHVKTQDSHASGQRIKKFPMDKLYLRKLLEACSVEPRLAIYKSRQMMVTWVMCIICLWEALFRPSSIVAIISLSQEDAGKLLDRIQIIYDNLPAHWKVALPTIKAYKGKGGVTIRLVIQHAEGGASTIQAHAQNGHPGRGETLSLAYWDEVGDCDDKECRRIYPSLMPTLEGGGRIVMSSTPPRDPEHFWETFASGRYFQEIASDG